MFARKGTFSQSGSQIVSNHVIFRVRAPRMVSRLGRLRQLSNGFGVFPLSRMSLRGTAQVQQETARAREYAATSPLSRVTAAAFPLASEYDTASSLARDHTCVCVCFILCDRLPYTAYVESPALAWCLYQGTRLGLHTSVGEKLCAQCAFCRGVWEHTPPGNVWKQTMS